MAPDTAHTFRDTGVDAVAVDTVSRRGRHQRTPASAP
jgi:hypothetical protein